MIAKGSLKISSGIVPHYLMREDWCTSSNLGASYSLHASDMVKARISEYNNSYYEAIEGSEEIIITHPSHLICCDET